MMIDREALIAYLTQDKDNNVEIFAAGPLIKLASKAERDAFWAILDDYGIDIFNRKSEPSSWEGYGVEKGELKNHHIQVCGHMQIPKDGIVLTFDEFLNVIDNGSPEPVFELDGYEGLL